jgi:hypothetical protein
MKPRRARLGAWTQGTKAMGRARAQHANDAGRYRKTQQTTPQHQTTMHPFVDAPQDAGAALRGLRAPTVLAGTVVAIQR